MGCGTEASAIRQEGPRGLWGRTSSRFYPARISLDRGRARKVVIRTLLADAVFQVSAAAEGPATGEVEGRARSFFS